MPLVFGNSWSDGPSSYVLTIESDESMKTKQNERDPNQDKRETYSNSIG